MLPNNQNDGNSQGGTGAPEQPTSPASPSGSQPLPDYVVAMQGRLDQQDALIRQQSEFIKGLQKGTDKQIGQVRGDIKRILELRAQGLNESQIQRELWIDQQMTGQPQSAPVQQPVGSEPRNNGIDVDTIVASLQFQPNDPALAALKVKYAGDPQGLVKAAADLRLSQFQTPNPTPGTGLSQSGATTSGLTADQADAKLLHLQDMYKNYSQNKTAIAELEKELKASGVLK